MQKTSLQTEKSKAISTTELQKCGGVAEEELSGEGVWFHEISKSEGGLV